MAFHQPARQTMQRIARPNVDDREVANAPQAAVAPAVSAQHPQHHDYQQQRLNDSQTWVLFSAADDATSASYLSETDHSVQTPNLSRISDLASLNTVAGSNRQVALPLSDDASAANPEEEDERVGEEEGPLGEDTELDSLDSHLPEFRSLPGIYSLPRQQLDDDQNAIPVLPGHDGLGSFRLDQPTLGQDAQDQIFQFERFNPQRLRQRQDGGVPNQHQPELEASLIQEPDKRQWIEAWRLEQSRLLLEEVQRETRRRRRSQSSPHRFHPPGTTTPKAPRLSDADSDGATWHDEDGVESAQQSEGFLARFTRTVVKDILGIDDRLLSALLGDSYPDEDDLSSTPRASLTTGQFRSSLEDRPAWHIHLLERVSRELGLLVNHISHHPGAFSTFQEVSQTPLPYAGLPAIPESAVTGGDTRTDATTPAHTSVPEFQPSVPRAARPIDIPGRAKEAPAHDDVNMGNTFTKEEWERDLDIKLVFRYLRSRFTSRSNPSTLTGSSSYLATTSSHDIAAKAARIRQHHPLVSRSRPVERRTFKATTPGSPVALRHHSSCASQSTRRSARRSSVSSRHYWDIGGSLGTGSMIASNGPMGSWGEV